MKVFCGTRMVGGKQRLVIVGAGSKRRAAEILGISLWTLNQWWFETDNEAHLEIANKYPEKILYTDLDYSDKAMDDYKVLQ